MKQRGFSGFLGELKYYVKVWLAVARLAVSRVNTYRIEVITRFARGLLVVVMQVILARAIVGGNSDYVGWTLDELYLFAGIFNTVGYASWSFFSINLWRMEEKILKGEFDPLLLKPTSSIFAAAFMDFFVDDLVSAVSGLLLIGYYVVNHYSEITLASAGLALVAVAAAFMIWFAMELIFASFDFVRTKNGMREIKKQLANVGRYPLDIWSGPSRLILYSVLPVAFFAHVPARLLTGYYSWHYAALAFGVGLVFVLLARQVWYWGIKQYTSAGG